ncbi:MAG: diguanylate cyclase [Alkalispirochaetaceae bacterium]
MKQKLADLKERFDRDIPNRISLIEGALRRVGRGEEVFEALSDMRGAAHRLAGSAATFGYLQLGRLAHRIEEEVDRLTVQQRTPDEQTLTRLRELTAQLGGNSIAEEGEMREFGELVVEEEEVELDEVIQDHDTGEADAEPLVVQGVYALNGDPAVPVELIEQIGVFGLNVYRLDSFASLAEGERAGGIFFLFVSLAKLSDQPEEITRCVRELRQNGSGEYRLFVFSEQDAFQPRLLSVRAGSDAFFRLPVDVSDVVEQIERMASEYSQPPYHVLIVDDDPEQVSNTALTLQSVGMITSVATDPQQVIPIMIENKPELIVLDMYLPGCTGDEVAKLIRQEEAFVGIPIIFLSSEKEKRKQQHAIASGGDDFLTKPADPRTLVSIVRTRANRTRSMRRLMERDSHTGLLNHSYLFEVLEREIQRAGRIAGNLCFAMIDIDHFKSVNDTYGHLVGDHVLRSLSRLLSERLRKTDTVGRYGGEEFGVVLFNASPEDAEGTLNNMRESFERISFHAGGDEFSVTFSCGVASFRDWSEPNALVEAADQALYAAKENGRNQVVLA